MAILGFGQEIRRGSLTCNNPASSASRSPMPQGTLRQIAHSSRVRPAHSLSFGLQMKFVLEVFSGSDRLAKALAHEGFSVLLWDINLDDEYDVRKRKIKVCWWVGLAVEFHRRFILKHHAPLTAEQEIVHLGHPIEARCSAYGIAKS